MIGARLPLMLAGAALTLLAAVPALAGETLLLASGRTLEAESVAFTDRGVRVTLPSGGIFLLPLEAVDSVVSAGPPEAPGSLPAGIPYREKILVASRQHGVDPVLVAAVVQVESAFDPGAISDAGACGLMQLLPETAREYGVDEVFDPDANLDAGVRHLRRLLDRYEEDEALALAAYNAGEGSVSRYRGVPPWRETRDYVDRVTTLVERWSSSDIRVR